MHDDGESVSLILIDFILDSNKEEDSELSLLFNNLKKKLQSPRSRYSTKQIETFDDLPIHSDLLCGIYSYGYEKPSEIQKKCILPIISSEPPMDFIVKSRGGTGRTASFCISIIQRLDLNLKLPNGCPQAMVMVPFRDSVRRVSKMIEKLGSFLNIKVMPLLGDSDQSIYELGLLLLKTSDDHVVVGTPGRILAFIQKQALNVKYLKILIMKDVDELIERGHEDQICQIVSYCTKINLQICLFGYLVDTEQTREFYGKVLRNPEVIQEEIRSNNN